MNRNEAKEIIKLMNTNDSYCQGAPQQVANGFYRAFEMLVLIMNELDEKKVYSREISNLEYNLSKNNSYCEGASQQSANGAYRIAELLKIMINYYDKNNKYTNSVRDILSVMNRNDSYCQGAPQQMANGTYRIVELLDILVKLIANQLSSEVMSSINLMNRNDSYCQGAAQQTANGTQTIFDILVKLAKNLDTNSKYLSSINSIVSNQSRNNSYCSGADQQSANNLYRTLELLLIITNIMMDEVEKSIEAYWREHADERNKLNQEKTDCNKQIKMIENEAAAIHENEEISKIQSVIDELETKYKNTGVSELQVLSENVGKIKAELKGVGLFKTALRKEIKERIHAAENEYQSKLNEVNAEKANIEEQIKEHKKKIKTLNDSVDMRRKEVLKGREKYYNRINEIEYELTRRR